jgi:magnesium chelatase subunit I
MLILPHYVEQIVEMIAVQARKSEFIDQQSGVSARMTISTMEALISNAERRAIINGESVIVPRLIDLQHALTGITGKVELVFEGEQEGPAKVARLLIGKAVREVFTMYFPNPLERQRQKNAKPEPDPYESILGWFGQGNVVELEDNMPFEDYRKELEKVPRLKELTLKHLSLDASNPYEVTTGMEFILDGLHQNSKIAKDEATSRISYKDMLGSIFTGRKKFEDDDDDWN